MKFEEKYEQHVKKINALRDQLKQEPENQALKDQIRNEEDEMFGYVMDSSKELEQFLREHKVETADDDED